MKNRFIKLISLESFRAFSVLELLLGLLIFSIVSASIYSVFWSGIRLDKRSESQNQIFREGRWTFMLMDKELENSIEYNFSRSYPEKSSFVGEKNQITFVITDNGKMKVVKYYLQPADETSIFQVLIGNVSSKNIAIENKNDNRLRTSYLIREEMSFPDFLNDNIVKDANKEVIASHVKSNGLRFYFGTSNNENSNDIKWEEEWHFGYVPSHIKVEIDFVSTAKKQTIKTFTKKILVPSGSLGKHE